MAKGRSVKNGTAIQFCAWLVLFAPAGFGLVIAKKKVCEVAPQIITGIQPEFFEEKLVSTLRWYGASEKELAQVTSDAPHTGRYWSPELKEFVDDNVIPFSIVDKAYSLIEQRLVAAGESEAAADGEKISRLTTAMLEKMLTGATDDEAPRPVSVYDPFANTDEETKGTRRRRGSDTEFYEGISLIKQQYGKLPSPRELSFDELKIAATQIKNKKAAAINIEVAARKMNVDVEVLKQWQDIRGTVFLDEAGKVRDMWKSDDRFLDFAEYFFNGKVDQAMVWAIERGSGGIKANGWTHYENKVTVTHIRTVRDMIASSASDFIKNFNDEAGSIKLAQVIGLPLTDPKKIQKALLAMVKPKLTIDELLQLNWGHVSRLSETRSHTFVPPAAIEELLRGRLQKKIESDGYGVLKIFNSKGGPLRLATELGYGHMEASKAREILTPVIIKSMEGTPLQRFSLLSPERFRREAEMRDDKGNPKPEAMGEAGLFAAADRYYGGVTRSAWFWAYRAGIQNEFKWPSYHPLFTVASIRELRERVKKSPVVFIAKYKTVDGAIKLLTELGFPEKEWQAGKKALVSVLKNNLTAAQIEELAWSSYYRARK